MNELIVFGDLTQSCRLADFSTFYIILGLMAFGGWCYILYRFGLDS